MVTESSSIDYSGYKEIHELLAIVYEGNRDAYIEFRRRLDMIVLLDGYELLNFEKNETD